MAAGVVAWLVVMAAPAGAQAATTGPPPAGAAVVVDLGGDVAPRVEAGVLARRGSASMAPMMAVYVGLSLVGATLAAITARRRILSLRAAELATGVAAGRRSRADFWNVPGLAWAHPEHHRTPATRPRSGARSGLPILVGSGDTVSIAEHRPPVRAGFAGGVSDG